MNKELVDYLKKKHINDTTFLSFIYNENSEDIVYKLCSVDGFDFVVSHFFDDSDKKGYGLVVTNEILTLKKENYIAIGLIEGDDIICMDVDDGSIYGWLVQTGCGEYIKLYDSFEIFLDECLEK